EMQLSPRAKRAIDLAYEEAQAMSHDYIGTEHLLLGLIREGEGLAARLLSELGADLERARRGFQAVCPIWVQIKKARQELESNEALYRALVTGPSTSAMPATTHRGGGEAEECETEAEGGEPAGGA